LRPQENAELSQLTTILGLSPRRTYATDADMATLRYGRLMLMCDQVRVCAAELTRSVCCCHLPRHVVRVFLFCVAGDIH
jgi:hypothetical protein